MPYSPNTDLREMMGFYLGHQGRFDDFLFDDPSDDWVGPMTWKKFYDFNPGQIILDPGGHGQKWSGGMTGSALPTFNDSGGSETDGQGSWQDQGVFSGATAQNLQILNDGMPTPTYYTPLQRNMGGQFLEDITDLNLGQNPLRVWDNGTLQIEGTDYTVAGPGLSLPGFSSAGMYLQWLVTPEGPVTAAFNFYFRVRFLTDDLDFEQFMAQLWTIGGAAGKNGRASLELTSSRRFP